MRPDGHEHRPHDQGPAEDAATEQFSAYRNRRIGEFWMLRKFLIANRGDLIERCRTKVAMRRAPLVTEAELEHGIPLFLQQLIDVLQEDLPQTPSPMLTTAARHGDELLHKGFTVAQVIHDYGDLCQAITALAAEMKAPIPVKEFGVLNRSLDDAIASAVTEHARQRELGIEAEDAHHAHVRLALLAHEFRNLLNTAVMSFEVIKGGSVAIDGATSAIHERSLRGLRSLVDRSLTDVRLAVGVHREVIQLGGFIEDVEQAAALEADTFEIRLLVPPFDPQLAVHADRQILASVLANLLQNAFKFTRANGRADVSLRVSAADDRVLIAVEDECGGLPAGEPEELLRLFEQRGTDRSGLGVGLAICKRGVEANGGVLEIRNLPGTGCVFTVELAQTAAAAS
jgi:hypothetical protein